MNLLFLSRLYHPHIGGVEKHVERLSKKLINKNHKITLITEQYQKSQKPQEKHRNVSIHRIPVFHSSDRNKKWAIWKWLWQNKELLEKADIIHIHDVFFWFLPFKLLFPKKPVYITFHGYEGSKPPLISAIIQRKIAEWLSSDNICVGDFMKKWYFTKPGLVTYGAADPITISGKPGDKAIYLGRLSEDTGIMTYLKALHLLKINRINIPLDIYGDGPQADQAKDYAKENNLKVTFHGFIKDASSRLQGAKFVFVSRYLGILEAMLARRLIFAVYNNQIKKDYLTLHPQAENMIIAGDADTLATHLLKFAKKHKMHDNSMEKSYKWAKRQTWKKLASDYEKLWKIKSA